MPSIDTIRVILPQPKIIRISVSFARGPAGPQGPAGASTDIVLGHAALRLFDTVAEAVQTVSHTVYITVGGAWVSSVWFLIAGTTADDDEYVIRPHDYNGVSNAKIWVKTGGQ